MVLQKKIYVDGEVNGTFTCEGDSAYAELVNLLLDKINKRYKVNITCDSVYNTIRGSLSFTHDKHDGSFTKYVYEYNFTDVDRRIDLR